MLSRRRATSNDLATGFTTTDTLVVNGTTFTFTAGTTSTGTTIGIGDNVGDLLSAIDTVTGGTVVDLRRRCDHAQRRRQRSDAHRHRACQARPVHGHR